MTTVTESRAERRAREKAQSAQPGIIARLRPTRHHVVDLVGTGMLVLIALTGLRETYFGVSWLVAGAVGILIGLACAHIPANLRLPGVVTAILAAAAYLLLGGPIATREALIGGVLPSPRTMSELARTAITGWKELLTTVPPVDGTGPLTALPFLLGLVGAALAYGVARRWAGAVRALVVPAALLVLSLLLGTLVPAAVLVQGVGFALVAIGYAALRASRGRAPLQNGAGQRTRVVTTALLLGLAATGAVLVGPRLPGGTDHGRTVWRTALEPPFDVAQYPSPLAGYRKFTEPNTADLYNRTLFTITGLPAGTPVRLATLDAYDGSVWGAGGPTSPSVFRRVGSHVGVTPPAGAQPYEARVSIPDGGWSDVWVPTAGAVSGIGFDGPRARALTTDLRFATETLTGLAPIRVMPGDTYRLSGYALPAQPTLPTDVPVLTGSPVDGETLAFLDGKIDQWSGRESDPWRRLLATANALRSTGAYTDGGPPGDYQNTFLPGHSLARITKFVKAPQLAGNDEQYAATLALVAARQGIPARVVLGAIPTADGTVAGKDVHAWVEVARTDGAWQTIPTSAFLPDRSKKPEQQEQRSDEKKTGANVPPPAANSPPSILQGPDQVQNAAANRSQGSDTSFLDPSTWPLWVRIVVGVVGIPVLLWGVAIGLVALARAVRRRRRRGAATTADQIRGGWDDLVDAATDHGLALPAAATRLEQARALDTRGAATEPLARRADALVFGPGDPDAAAVTTYWGDVASARTALRDTVSRRDRLRALTSLRSFAPAIRAHLPKPRSLARSALARRPRVRRLGPGAGVRGGAA